MIRAPVARFRIVLVNTNMERQGSSTKILTCLKYNDDASNACKPPFGLYLASGKILPAKSILKDGNP
ncbi:MAG: hypothetical protein Aurels2KO_23740 [Aureliella sp.]